ncbi:PAS domain S-box protein, partial [Ramlibacter sp.]|uniref:PAS domain-containing sensor histidine kinase n=1 Tax=Ramlibacter sp. TaxID=1917967 RepID=UPI0035AFCD39
MGCAGPRATTPHAAWAQAGGHRAWLCCLSRTSKGGERVAVELIPGVQSAAWLAGLLDSAMDAIICADAGYRIVLYNRAAERIFGWPGARVLGQPLSMLLPERFRTAHDQHLGDFARTGVSGRRMSGSTVVNGLRASGEEFPVDASISQLDTPQGRIFTVILRDVTERVQAERAQARLAARLVGLLDSAMDGIITVDASQTIVLYNRAAERLFGWPAAEVIGQPLGMLIPSRLRAGHHDHVARFGATGVTSRRMGDRTVLLGLRASGEEFPIDASISQLDLPEGKLYSVIVRDVTERVRAQEELVAFAAEAAGAREEEKARVARELHDELAQSLTVLKMDANWLLATTREAPALQDKLHGMVQVIDEAVAATRRIAADLRPLVLDDLGVLPAMEWLASAFTQRHGVPCRMDVPEDFDLPEPRATGVFRMLQESLVNVAKHARAREVRVRVERDGPLIVMTIEDDGVGFDPAAPRKTQ